MNRYRTLFYILLIIFAPFSELYAETPILSLNIPDNLETGVSSRAIQIIALITILSVAPSILIMVTSFARIVIVLSLVRSALGTQQTPPNSILISLALFMTFFIMSPTLEESYNNGLEPLIKQKIDEETAISNIINPFKKFMLSQVREKDLTTLFEISKISPETIDTPENTPLNILIPSFMISELRRAFEIGFLIYLPFLIMEMLISAILMTMGMMMLPPVVVSLPFKIIFFVMIDGWNLITQNLVKSFL